MAPVASGDPHSWSCDEVRLFLQSVLPAHAAAARFSHTTGRILCSLEKEDLRRQAKDEEAANVIWFELLRAREEFEAKQDIAAHGAETFTLFVRTPAEIALEFEVVPMDAVLEVKARIASLEGTPVEAQRLMWNGVPMTDTRTLASYNVSHGSTLLLVPRLGPGGARYSAAPATKRAPPPAAGGLRPSVPIVCGDIHRPFPMRIEFQGIGEYQSFMLALQRQVGRRDMTGSRPAEETAPYLEILPLDDIHAPVQTRVLFDAEAEMLVIDSLGDIMMPNARYKVLLHLRSEQKIACLVTGPRED